MFKIKRIAMFVIVATAFALTLAKTWDASAEETEKQKKERRHICNNYEFDQHIPDAPKTLITPKGLYNLREKPGNVRSRCEWYKDGQWKFPSWKLSPKRVSMCCKEMGYTWGKLLKLYLEGLVKEAACYRDDYHLGVYIAYGASFSGNYKFPKYGVDDKNFRKFFTKKVLTSPRAVAELYKWAKPSLEKALQDMAPIDREMYIAALEHGIQYLKTADIKAEKRYLKKLQEDEEEKWFNRERPDGTYDSFRYVETFLFRRLQDGVSKKFLMEYLKKGLKLLEAHQDGGDTILAKVEFIKNGLGKRKTWYERSWRAYMEALQTLGNIQDVCLTPKYYHLDLPPENELVNLSFKELLSLSRKLRDAEYKELDDETERLEEEIIPAAQKEHNRIVMYNDFMIDMDDLFGCTYQE
jgi:hypothetical protein